MLGDVQLFEVELNMGPWTLMKQFPTSRAVSLGSSSRFFSFGPREAGGSCIGADPSRSPEGLLASPGGLGGPGGRSSMVSMVAVGNHLLHFCCLLWFSG